MPLVSVIMPVYNMEDCVEDTARAVLTQTVDNLELIICDDGSMDDTLARCEGLAASDARVKVRSIAHGGVSRARNQGLVCARGNYVAFADADDLPLAGWLESLLETMEGSDLAVCGYEVHDSSGAFVRGTGRLKVSRSMPAEEFLVALFSNELMYQGYVWNKLFRRDIIERHGLRFDEGVVQNEDRLFVFEYLEHCDKVALGPDRAYVYRARTEPCPYRTALSTEIDAFDAMIERLRSLSRRGNVAERALFFAEKDCFRAYVELAAAAQEAGSPDALWLAEGARHLARYAGEFPEYPEAFHAKMQDVLGA